jgi:hypothetical protein
VITIVMSIVYLYPNYIEQLLMKLQAITKANIVGILARRIIGGYPKMGDPSFLVTGSRTNQSWEKANK